MNGLKKKGLLSVILAAGLVGLIVPLFAQEDAISISTSVDKSRMTIGDLITYTVAVAHDEEIRVEMPGLGANLGSFQIRDYEVHDPKKEKGRIVSSVDYVISTFFTGEFEIPPLTIRYFTPGDSTAKALTTQTIEIVVESVKPSEAGDIRDIKPPVEIPRDVWHTLRWFVLGAFFLLLASLSYVVYRRKKAGKPLLPARAEPPRPPHEVAYERLDALKGSDRLERGEIKEYYIEVSEIIRQYVEGRYYLVALEMTTTEVLEQFTRADVSEDEVALFQAFLERCDLVKFAKLIPSAEENDAILKTAYEIIDRTKVIIEELDEADDESEAEARGETVEMIAEEKGDA